MWSRRFKRVRRERETVSVMVIVSFMNVRNSFEGLLRSHVPQSSTIAHLRGRHGFDVGCETLGVHAEAQGSS